jgi:Holliday junction resolvase-like predicted endonuclease
VEVKTRRDAALATDLAISFEKNRRLQSAVRHYCFHRDIGGVGIILVGVIILVDKKSKTVKIRYVVLRQN